MSHIPTSLTAHTLPFSNYLLVTLTISVLWSVS